MPYKDQTRCYRTINGVKWFNLCDVLDDRDEADVEACKIAGVRIKMRKHSEGYQQAFFHPCDDALVTKTLQSIHC